MADVILVQPKVGDWDDLRSHPSLPLALLSAARLVAKEFDTILIDTRVDRHWRKRLKEELEKKPLCVGITSMTGRQIHYALEISEYAKKISDIPVVWGGIHSSLLPESTLENKNIDIIVIGEGEVSFLELLRAQAAKRSLKGLEGIWFKDKGLITANPNRKFTHLDNLPQMPLSLVDLKKYLPLFKGRRTFHLETSRGCPNRCLFCYNAAYNKNTWRAFSAERTIQDLKDLTTQFDISSYYLIDDNFFVDLRRAAAIARGIIDEKLDIIWEVQGITINSALRMDDEYLDLLVKSGMKKVHFGVESGSQRILNSVNKNLEIGDIIKINRRWRQHDIIIQHNFMCGFPQETLDDIRKTKDLIFELMAGNPNALISPVCPYTPYPGTAMYEKAIDDGFVKLRTSGEWAKTDYGDNLWQSKQRKKFLSALFFASMFLDKHRVKDMFQSKMIRFLIELYRPFAKFRVKHLFFKVMPEIRIKNIVLFIQGKTRNCFL